MVVWHGKYISDEWGEKTCGKVDRCIFISSGLANEKKGKEEGCS